MKKISITLISAIFILLGSSCTPTELMDYEGKDGIYFYVQRVPPSGYGDTTIWSANASTFVEFTKIPVADTTLHLRVMTTGVIKNYDRPLNISINKDSTTAKENENYIFESNNNVIKAGMHYSDVMIKIIRSEELQTKTLRATLELKPNEHFGLAFEKLYSLPGSMPMDSKDEGHNPSLHSVFMNYLLVRPVAWVPALDFPEGGQERGLLGQFSKKKFEIVSEVCNIIYDDFSDKGKMPMGRVQVLNQQVKAYLISQYNKGTPVLEDDGRLMWVMNVPWSSYIGVPYIPGTN